jgi:hypothetical protein
MRKRTEGARKPDHATLNQRVQGSSLCAPTNQPTVIAIKYEELPEKPFRATSAKQDIDRTQWAKSISCGTGPPTSAPSG